MKWDIEVDARGLLCPLPVLRARKRMASLQNGQIMRLLVDDPAAVVDVPHFCTEQGHKLLEQHADHLQQIYLLRKCSK